MAVNSSKPRQPRFWKVWYVSGSVPQKNFPQGSLVIIGIGTHYQGKAAGHQTLSLGVHVVESGPDWSLSEPLCAVVVPASDKYEVGMTLEELPANAVPVEVFFS